MRIKRVVCQGNITIASDLKCLQDVRHFVSQFIIMGGLRSPEALSITLAIDEAVSNIIRYAYHDDPSGVIDIRMEIRPDRVVATIADTGRPFNPLRHPTPKVRTRIKKGRPGGLGILLIRKNMDGVTYRREAGSCNLLKMTKLLRKSSEGKVPCQIS